MTNRATHTTSTGKFLQLAVLFAATVFKGGLLFSQSVVYDNFEGTKVIRYVEKFGVLDTLAKNPAPNEINKSEKCGLYVRNGSKKFDNIKMGLSGHLTEVEKYATYLGVPPRLKMKIYTSAPPGTLVEILLGSKRGNNDYPAGTHSQYQAYTKVSNQWEELEFLFSQVPQGSETAANQIDQVTLLFNPNSSNSDTYYFDEITGPPVIAKTATMSSTGSTDTEEQSVGDPAQPAVNSTQTVTTQGTTGPEKKQPKSKTKKSEKK